MKQKENTFYLLL